MKEKAIEHYQRMINWAKKQEKKEKADWFKMYCKIHEWWGGAYCNYCIKYNGVSACNCPLGDCPTYCCKGLWAKMHLSETWGEWVKNAIKVLGYIKEKG